MWWRRRHSFPDDGARLKRARAAGDALLAPQRAVHELFAEVASADLAGAERVGNRWVTPAADGAFRMLGLLALKGASYTPQWGLSLPYVPHGRRFHRTGKSARHALWAQGHDEGQRVSYYFGNGAEIWWIPSEIDAMWRATAEEVRAFFAATSTTEGVLAVALKQASRPSIHQPRPRFVAAFAAARLGDAEQATTLLEAELERWDDRDADEARAAMTRCLAADE